jgi:hypothetical protein
VDSIAAFVGHPNRIAVEVYAWRPEAWRHYSWSFNRCARSARERDGHYGYRKNVVPVNPIDVALLARYDHVVAKYARRTSMVERNPVVVR